MLRARFTGILSIGYHGSTNAGSPSARIVRGPRSPLAIERCCDRAIRRRSFGMVR